MVYDDLNLPDENEISRMIKDFCGHFVRKEVSYIGPFFRQLLDMFNVLAYDKLKADTKDLNNVEKCKEIVGVWEDAIKNFHLLDHFEDGRFPDKFHQYLDSQVRCIKPPSTQTLDQWILEKFKDHAHHSKQAKQTIYLGHIIMSRGSHAASEIRNRMNPLWNLADIPSGKSLTDMLRAIRFHVFKIAQYKLGIEATKRKAEYKDKVWDEDAKVEYIREDMQERFDKFVPEFTWPDFWLAFLVCSYPVDHYLQHRKSLPLLVPPMDPNVEFHPPVTSSRSTRRSDRDRAGQVPGTASARRSRSIAESTEDDEGGNAGVTTFQMNHTFNSGSLKNRRSSLKNRVFNQPLKLPSRYRLHRFPFYLLLH